MKIFTINKEFSVVCQWVKTRQAFKHTAAVMKNGWKVHETKICYQNRTWESYEYQSVLHKAINDYFGTKAGKKFIAKLEAKPKDKPFKAVAAVCAIGGVLCETQAEKNAWNKKMLSTVHGVNFPDDFDKLSEDEQKTRLEGALAMLTKEV